MLSAVLRTHRHIPLSSILLMSPTTFPDCSRTKSSTFNFCSCIGFSIDERRPINFARQRRSVKVRTGRVVGGGALLGDCNAARRPELAKLRFQRLFARGDARTSTQSACHGHQVTPTLVVEGRQVSPPDNAQLSRGRRSSRIASMRASAARLSWTWSRRAPISPRTEPISARSSDLGIEKSRRGKPQGEESRGNGPERSLVIAMLGRRPEGAEPIFQPLNLFLRECVLCRISLHSAPSLLRAVRSSLKLGPLSRLVNGAATRRFPALLGFG